MRLKLIACDMLHSEMAAALKQTTHYVEVEFMPKALHDIGCQGMQSRLQAAVDRVDPAQFDAVLLGYGLCGNGIHGLVSRTVPIVVPRVHDCIGLLMGSREKQQQYFEKHLGVYFRSTGWLERGTGIQPLGYSMDNLVSRYGEDNGRYLYEQLSSYRSSYRQLTFIKTGAEVDDRPEETAREEAAGRGWNFEVIAGSLRLFEELLQGDWEERDFLVVPPGWRVRASYQEGVIDKEPAN
jgi:hypothetical protein